MEKKKKKKSCVIPILNEDMKCMRKDRVGRGSSKGVPQYKRTFRNARTAWKQRGCERVESYANDSLSLEFQLHLGPLILDKQSSSNVP